ncbi:MAG: Transcription factor TFIIIB component B [Alectoria fallacina]|uniref:Transcription factor TFIIIB component B n=1 Tax=Alectoria fallacina TaxID=1903189 RepID=A0A8H3IW28_9LECA|nr:MAG: Transcription factor TFIIIB component B [Alectoria fallacina]
MSALGSSVISASSKPKLSPSPADDACTDKSGKKFAPKAPARRAPAPTSGQSSARPSADRQLHSQTPQPQSLQQHVASSPTHSRSLPKAASIQQPTTAVLAKTFRSDEATTIPLPSRSTQARKYASPAPVVPRKRPSSPLKLSRQLRPVSQPVIDASRAPESSGPVIIPNEASLKQTGSHDALVPSSTGVPDGSVAETTSTSASMPALKRRRVEKPPEQTRIEQSRAPIAKANVPILSTEVSEAVAESSANAQDPAVSISSANPKKPRLSAQEKRKQHIADAAAEVVADATRSSSARAKKPRQNAKRKNFQRDESTEAGTLAGTNQPPHSQAEEDTAPTKAKRNYTKKKTRHSIEDAAAGVVEDAVQGSSKDPRKHGWRRKRAPTPEDAETIQIMPSEIRMMDLCRDGGTGRKSEREKELEELERAEFIRKKQRQLKEVMGEAEPESQATPLESTEVRQDRLARQREQEENVAHNVPNTIIVNGQIQIDEASLEIDRHAAAALERNAEQLDAVEETDMTRKINSATWLKRDKSSGWNEMLTERFYDGLRMFGTDFEMISKMFPGRTRHKIKLKFCKEEKINGDRIKATLLGEKLAVDLPELEKMAGTEFDDPEELEKDLEEDRIRLQEETAAEKQAMDEGKREREEQIAAEQAAAENDSSAKENRRGKGKKKGPKRKSEKGEKGSSRKKDKQAQRAASAGGGGVFGELAEALGAEM